jgi:hypothetical protein
MAVYVRLTARRYFANGKREAEYLYDDLSPPMALRLCLCVKRELGSNTTPLLLITIERRKTGFDVFLSHLRGGRRESIEMT